MSREMVALTQQRVMLVERKDVCGALGVWRQDARYVCPLPDGYDGRTSVRWHDGYVLAAHPELPPLRCDFNTGKVDLVQPGHIEAKDGRMKLLTR